MTETCERCAGPRPAGTNPWCPACLDAKTPADREDYRRDYARAYARQRRAGAAGARRTWDLPGGLSATLWRTKGRLTIWGPWHSLDDARRLGRRLGKVLVAGGVGGGRGSRTHDRFRLTVEVESSRCEAALEDLTRASASPTVIVLGSSPGRSRACEA